MKKIRTYFAILLCILVVVSASLPALAAQSEAPALSARAALLVDLQSGRALVSHNADEKVYPASLTKIMTCLLALENSSLDDIVTVSETALADIDPDGTSADLKAGEQISMNDLLHLITVYSANEACNVIAEHVSGSVPAFLTLMNQRARELGCTNTNFTNTHGLHDEAHYTTARDLSLITTAALEHEAFRLMTDKASYTVPATNMSAERRVNTSNYLISRQTREDYYYPNASGIKTGFTTPAGRCLISRANNGTLDLLVVICGAATMIDTNGNVMMESFTDARTLFDYGFSTFRTVTLVSPLEPLGEVPVSLSANVDSSVFAPAEKITTLLPRDYDPELVERIVKLDNPDGIEAPVAKDQKLGTVEVRYDGEVIGSTDLLAIAAIERSFMKQMGSKISAFFQSSAWNIILAVIGFLAFAFVITLVILFLRARRNRKRRRDQRRREQMLSKMHGGNEQ